MNLPNILSDWLNTQAHFNSIAYANCFAANAIIYDEGKMIEGKDGIIKWNEKTNAKYHIQYRPIDVLQSNDEMVLTIEVPGTFDASPILLDYHFVLEGDKIFSLKIKNA